MNYTAPPYTFWVLLSIGLVVAIYLTYREFHRQKTGEAETATYIYDAEMGEHITQVRNALKEWKEQLQSLVRKRNLKNLDAVRNNTIEFEYAQQHCPSLRGVYPHLLIYAGFYENDLGKLRSKQEVKRSRELLRGKINLVIKAIDKSLKSHEYTKKSCDGCPRNIIEQSSATF